MCGGRAGRDGPGREAEIVEGPDPSAGRIRRCWAVLLSCRGVADTLGAFRLLAAPLSIFCTASDYVKWIRDF
jgi:hypothetical protein